MKLILSLIFFTFSVLNLHAQVPPSLSFDPDYETIPLERLNKEEELLGMTLENEDLFISPSPNPVDDQMKLDIKLVDSEFQIFDLNGRIVDSGRINVEILDASSLESGVYVLVIQTTSNHRLNFKFSKVN